MLRFATVFLFTLIFTSLAIAGLDQDGKYDQVVAIYHFEIRRIVDRVISMGFSQETHPLSLPEKSASAYDSPVKIVLARWGINSLASRVTNSQSLRGSNSRNKRFRFT